MQRPPSRTCLCQEPISHHNGRIRVLPPGDNVVTAQGQHEKGGRFATIMARLPATAQGRPPNAAQRQLVLPTVLRCHGYLTVLHDKKEKCKRGPAFVVIASCCSGLPPPSSDAVGGRVNAALPVPLQNGVVALLTQSAAHHPMAWYSALLRTFTLFP